MKLRNLSILGLLLLSIGVTACSSASSAAATTGNTASGTGGAQLITSEALKTDYENALPVDTQLALGMVLLQDSDYPIDAAKAAELLPLWKAVRTLSASDAAATAEIQAVFQQIEETLGPEQLQVIAGMQLTREAMAQVFQELGMETGMGAGMQGQASPEMQSTLEAARASGQAPQGGFGPGAGGGPPAGGFGGGPGGGGFGGEAISPEARQTAIAENGNARPSARLGVPSMLVEAVIEYLEGIG